MASDYQKSTSGFYYLVSFLIVCPLIAESLPWRRVADLYVMIASAFISMLGWKLYAEGVTAIFQQEEGRYDKTWTGLEKLSFWQDVDSQLHLFICSLMQMSNQPIIQQQLHAFILADWSVQFNIPYSVHYLLLTLFWVTNVSSPWLPFMGHIVTMATIKGPLHQHGYHERTT